MPNRILALTTILRSPMRILGLVLTLFFAGEVAVMLALPYLMPGELSYAFEAVVDAVLLTLVCAPVLWMVIIGPLRRIAIQEHERSETIVANAGESILTFDPQGQILSCNRAATELFGVDAEALMELSIRSLIPSIPAAIDELPSDFRLDAQRIDGESFPAQVSVSEYPSASGSTRIAIVRDLTQAEHAERERINMARQTEALRAQQMATLAQLATGVAHEIRNPLTSIKMLIQVNRTKFADEGLPTDDLQLVEQEIRRMERSVNSLLDYARPETSEFKDFAIQDALRRTIQLIEGRCVKQKVTLKMDVPDQAICVNGDAAQIQQLFLNLALNALDAMPDGGELSIAIAQREADVVISVCDDGSGICESVLGRLFTPFVTTKAGGVGLGLGICRRIAEAHQGKLTGVNRMTGGAKFELMLPLAKRPTQPSMANEYPSTSHSDAAKRTLATPTMEQ
ncbi:two-component system sensor histidine kinase NtrB [Aporhodopirellula aestuarii]|uniref:histidine kinase n=1 Tax=Aporhodopirellula aestuarii TaxID=2950107 RepID=A0ABT0UBL5_9BACT|nr:ATP-binding protein [Aporhodopirellula aestuarii]MCM2374109.1 ATP-binding protein [Aporhodopirellula aestuarii]